MMMVRVERYEFACGLFQYEVYVQGDATPGKNDTRVAVFDEDGVGMLSGRKLASEYAEFLGSRLNK